MAFFLQITKTFPNYGTCKTNNAHQSPSQTIITFIKEPRKFSVVLERIIGTKVCLFLSLVTKLFHAKRTLTKQSKIRNTNKKNAKHDLSVFNILRRAMAPTLVFPLKLCSEMSQTLKPYSFLCPPSFQILDIFLDHILYQILT